jgi:hypothetical protein
MIFEITSIVDAGNLDKERVVIKAKEAGDIGQFALFKTSRADGTSVNAGGLNSVFWFEDHTVKAGDFVVLYTKSGSPSEKAGTKNTSYFFYWDLKKTIWDSDDDVPVLVQIRDFEILSKRR